MSNNLYDRVKQYTKASMIGLTLGLTLIATSANAGMLSTQSYVQPQYQQQQLLNTLESQELQQQLLDLGVEPDAITERIASLTDAEISLLNERLSEEPAGAGVLGALVTVFVVFMITDALCATDVFTFVKCINK